MWKKGKWVYDVYVKLFWEQVLVCDLVDIDGSCRENGMEAEMTVIGGSGMTENSLVGRKLLVISMKYIVHSIISSQND